MRSRLRASLSVALLLAGGLALAHVRLRHPGSGSELRWPDPANIAIVIAPGGSDDLGPRGHEAAIRNAIDAWNGAAGQLARIVEDASEASRARADWQASDLHLCFFDESDQTGYFPPGSGAVAITPIWFFQSGSISDADVIFNGRDFRFTTNGEPGRFDLQDVTTHELGHFLGLDHSGWAGSSMYPFVDPEVLLHRSLSWDEVSALRDAYPNATHSKITGTVRRKSDESVVAGAHVVVRDAAGRTRASTLSAVDGRFEVEGLSAGTYGIYATPLDEPVSASALGPGWTVHTDFRSTIYGNVALGDAVTFDMGDLRVDGDVDFGLGLASDRLPLRGIAGTTTGHRLGGRNLSPGSVLEASDPSIVVAPTAWNGTSVEFQISVPPGAQPGHVDLLASGAAGRRSVLVAAIEITPPDPSVDSVTPAQGSPQGGTALSIRGNGFRPGARVVMGGEIYVDGAPGGASVVDATTIALTTRPSLPGTTDVIVIDPSGVEGRRIGGYRFVPQPAVTSVFPSAGSSAGGTRVLVKGRDFVPGATVRIDGVQQSLASYAPDLLVIAATTPGLVGGAGVLEVRNPDGESATGSFRYVLGADPSIQTVSPDRSSASGGEQVTVLGGNFGSQVQLVFGADPTTGQGGAPALTLTLADASTLLATTPPLSPGIASVMVVNASTGQAALLPGAIEFNQDKGGGCHAVPMDGGAGARRALETLAGLGLLLLALRASTRRALAAQRA